MPQWMLAPDFESSFPDARLKAQMDRGPAKYRLGTSAAPIPVQGVIRCTLDQLARGDRFWREELRGGTLPFVFPGQVLNNTPLCDESGEPLTDESDVPVIVAPAAHAFGDVGRAPVAQHSALGSRQNCRSQLTIRYSATRR
jgi:hypothetical protein